MMAKAGDSMPDGRVVIMGALLLAATACNRGIQPGSSGGSSGNGGVTASGGSGSGGTSSSGGSSAQGGTVGIGGSSKSGGAPGSGGSATDGAAGGTGGGVSVTTLGGGKPIGTLTPTEATQLCADTFAYFGQAISKPTLCKWTGLTYAVSSSAPSDTRLQENCKGQENACLAAGPASPSCRALPAACTATVSQYAACIVDNTAALNAGVERLAACSTVKMSDLEAVWAFVTEDPPASCTALSELCPALDVPTPRPGSTGAGGAGGAGSGGAAGATGAGGAPQTGGTTGATGGAGGTVRTGGTSGATGGTSGGTGGANATGGAASSGGTAGATGLGALPGDIAKAAGTPFVAAHAMTRALFAAYTGPLFRALRDSDKQEKDIGIVAGTGLVDLAALSAHCSGTTCKVTTLYDQSGNGNDMWRGDTAANSPMENGEAPRLCDLMAIDYWQLADGTKLPVVVETGPMWKDKAQCLRNRDKTKNMPTGAKPQTTYAIFHAKYLNNNCCFNYGNTGKLIHYTGPGTLSALNFSKIEFWSKGKGTGPWVMVDWEQGVYAGNVAKCGSGVPASAECTTTGENASNPSVTFDVVTALFKHDGVNHWAAKHGNAKAGPLAISIDLPTLPKGGYSPLKQEGGLGLGEGGAGDPNGTGGFSEGAVMAGETSDATDNAIQQSIVGVYGK